MSGQGEGTADAVKGSAVQGASAVRTGIGLSHWERVGPQLGYSNSRAREMEQNVEGFARLVNNDMHALLKWAASLNGEIDRLQAANAQLRTTLWGLHRTGMALVPHMPPMPAGLSIEWDEAMDVARELSESS